MQVKHTLPCDFLLEQKVKGKAQPVKIYDIAESYVIGTDTAALSAMLAI